MAHYNDNDFTERRRNIRSIPYLREVNENIINDILYLMKPRRYEPGMVIFKQGDNVNQLMLVKSGYIAVEVPKLSAAIHTVKKSDEDANENASTNSEMRSASQSVPSMRISAAEENKDAKVKGP